MVGSMPLYCVVLAWPIGLKCVHLPRIAATSFRSIYVPDCFNFGCRRILKAGPLTDFEGSILMT
jgi:hypothetical protein